MTSVPLGRGAYKRLYAGAPEVKLLNRFLEANPANPTEGTSVLARPGTTRIADFSPGSWAGLQSMRGNFTLSGLFGDVLWVVCGQKLYFVDDSMNIVQVTGTLTGTQTPEIAWQAGAGYQRLWIADGGLLYYYDGDANAAGTLTFSGTVTQGTVVQVGSTYYIFRNAPTPVSAWPEDGSVTKPYSVMTNFGTSGDPLTQLYLAITATGRANADYSANIVKPNPQVTVYRVDATHLQFTASVAGISGNSVATVVTGAGASFGAATLTGGIGVLNSCAMPDPSQQALSLTQVSGYVLVSVANTQQFYWINPGDTTIDSLNFASKESSPDAITSMRTVGDQVLIMGSKSTENWYATGDSTAPFAPIEGRVYARGVLQDTPVVVDDAVILVGDDGRVYSIGFQSGDTSDVGWGVLRISNNGIEERIRRQVRRELGLNP